MQQSTFRSQGKILGLNIGKNAATPIEHAAHDYLLGLTGVYPYADYITVNISSPNTHNLRALQSDDALASLLTQLDKRREELTAEHGRRIPIFIKIAPDLDESQIDSSANALVQHGMDGVIATNTTLARDAVRDVPHAGEAGGLSGTPLLTHSNQVITLLRASLDKACKPPSKSRFPIIGVGGIMCGADAVAKIKAGADAVQIYSGLIYRGSALVPEVARALSQACNSEKIISFI